MGSSLKLFFVAVLCHQNKRIDVAFEYSAHCQISAAYEPQQIKEIGLKAAFSINKDEPPLAEMLANTAINLEKTAAELAL